MKIEYLIKGEQNCGQLHEIFTRLSQLSIILATMQYCDSIAYELGGKFWD